MKKNFHFAIEEFLFRQLHDTSVTIQFHLNFFLSNLSRSVAADKRLLHLPIYIIEQGLRNNLTDACENHDPCQHGGICISTDSGPICECRNMEYEGPYCEKGESKMSPLRGRPTLVSECFKRQSEREKN